MADLQQLERALRNADAAGDVEAARTLAGEIQRMRAPTTQQAQQMTHQPGPKPAGSWAAMKQGASSRLDKISDGILQRMYAGDPNVQRGLKALDQQRSAADAPVQKEHPLAFGMGDSAPMLAIPGGQRTAVGRVLAPAVGAAAMEALSFGTPEERAKRAAVAGATGAGGGVLGEALTWLALPRMGAPGLTKDTAAAAARNQFPLTMGDRTGSGWAKAMESYLENVPGSVGVMARNKQQKMDVLNELAAKSIGQDASSITPDVLAAARKQIGNERGALQANVRVSPVHPDLITGVRRAREVANQLSNGPQSLTGPQVSAATKIIDDMENFIRSGSPMSGDQYSTWRTALREAKESAYDAKNSKLGEAYAELQHALDRAAQGGYRKQWRLNDQQYSALQAIEKGQVVNEATGNISPRRLANETAKRYQGLVKEGGLEGPLADLSLLAKGVPEHREGSQTALREGIQKATIGGGALAAGLATTGTVDPMLAALLLGVPSANYLMARAMTSQGKRLGSLMPDSPILTEALREQLQRAVATGVQGAARGTVVPGLAVPH